MNIVSANRGSAFIAFITRYQLIKQSDTVPFIPSSATTYKCNTLAREMRDESTSLFSATLISLMTEDFTLDELAELPLEAFCDLLQEKGKGRFKQPEKIAKAIQRAITMSYRLGALAQESINVCFAQKNKVFISIIYL
ncbi:hypothetical protein EfmAA94_10700 [Enterococcus faecium]|nr:hypothetical protein EfmAA94_10700 [Enterococcus faecium]